jgi:hypothetical protein
VFVLGTIGFKPCGIKIEYMAIKSATQPLCGPLFCFMFDLIHVHFVL